MSDNRAPVVRLSQQLHAFAVLVVVFALNVATSASVVLISTALIVEIEWVNLQYRNFINKRCFWMHITIIYILKQ